MPRERSTLRTNTHGGKHVGRERVRQHDRPLSQSSCTGKLYQQRHHCQFLGNYERDLTEKDRLTFIVRHELARYEIPNELVQQNGAYLPNSNNDIGCPPVPPDEPSDCVFIPGGQLQTGDNFETMGSASYQHTFSSDAIGWLR